MASAVAVAHAAADAKADASLTSSLTSLASVRELNAALSAKMDKLKEQLLHVTAQQAGSVVRKAVLAVVNSKLVRAFRRWVEGMLTRQV